MSNKTLFPSLAHKVAEGLLEPYTFIEQSSGKGMRSLLIDAFNLWFQVPESELNLIKEIVTKLHNASLLIDDIEDNSKMRRGNPVAHLIYGIPNTINTANYMYFLAMEMCWNTGNQEAVSVFIEELLQLHRGQGHDILWRDNNACPSEEEYKGMVMDKTGGLFRLATRLMQAFAKDKRDFIPLVNLLGLYYQIRDDYINLWSDKYMENKSFCEDLSEGKFSFPIIHSITSNPNDRRLLNILKRRTEDIDIKKHAVAYMKTTGSFDYTKKVLDDLRLQILTTLDGLGGNEKITKILEQLETNLV